MDKYQLAEICDARDKLCNFCEVNECEKCIVQHLVDDAHNELNSDDSTYTAFLYGDNGVSIDNMDSFDDEEDAVQFAIDSGWDEVVNDISGEVVYRR